MSEPLPVTAEVSTRGRYDTTLPACLMAIATQLQVPRYLRIYYDDGVPVQLSNREPYNHIFRLLGSRGCQWDCFNTPAHGQVKNHQTTLEQAPTEFIWRVDDDNVPETNTLYRLYDSLNLDDRIGAVGGLVLNPSVVFPDDITHSSDMVDNMIYGVNSQWVQHGPTPNSDFTEVEHLYSTFLYRKSAAKHGYNMDLSVVGHREETFFTYQMFRAGYKLLIDPRVVTWHLRGATGGIHRPDTQQHMWDHDEQLFRRWLVSLGVELPKVKLCALVCGLGDLCMFARHLPALLKKYEGWQVIIAHDNKVGDVFDGIDGIIGVSFVSLSTARQMMGGSERALDCFDTYSWAKDHGITEDFHLAFKQLFVDTNVGEIVVREDL